MRIPEILKRINRHNELFEAMARKLHRREALVQVPESAGVYRRASMRCMTCRHADACEQWLQQADEPETAPDYCRNKGLFARLKRLEPLGDEPDCHGSGSRPTGQML